MRPAALLFVTPGCVHCAAVKQALATLVREGAVAQVIEVDATQQPELAAQHGVRSAPWLEMGPFTLSGAQTLAELRQWAAWAESEAGTAHYLEHLLRGGEFTHARAFVVADAARLQVLLAMLADTELGIDVRLGVSALLERYAGHARLQALIPELSEMTRHADHRVRADAAHLLGLTGSAAARKPLELLRVDEHEEVREIAHEALAALAHAD
ncbi:MAG: thioredoxin family protein [Pseudomonadota bacterium]